MTSESLTRARRSAVFLDRDGVLNEDLCYVATFERFRWMPDAVAAVAWLKAQGFLVFVVTNQSGVARGFFEESDVEALHRYMQGELGAHGTSIDAFRYCPHHPRTGRAPYRMVCRCRKPAPGMLEDLVTAYDIARDKSLLIGDATSDLVAAAAAGIAAHRFPGGSLLGFVQEVAKASTAVPS